LREEFVEIGVVKALYRYLVKSMRGQSLSEGHIHWHGLDGDRRAAFVRGDNTTGFPWLTGRETPNMVRYEPYFVRPEDPINSPLRVKTPAGRDVALESDELRQELVQAYGYDVHLIKIKRGVFDSMPLSLLSLATARALGRHIGDEVDSRRFRPNIVVETFANLPSLEEEWIGGSLLFGQRPDSARIQINRRIERCVMVNIDPQTAERDARILKAVAQTRDTCLGVYGSTESPGSIRVGDTIRLV
jgi:uncharacterized protein YcbX